MENISKIKKVLEFYNDVNKLKTTIINNKLNYSVADHIYGSLIIAVAMNSEFKECKNIGKILKFIVLNELNEKKYNEVSELTYEEYTLISKFKKLELILTDFISNNSTLTKKELLTEFIILLKEYNVDYKNITKYIKVFNFYYLCCKLKHKERSGWDYAHWNVKTDRPERISEHIVGTVALAIVTDTEFNYSNILNINIDNVLKILTIHEIGEILIGDITPFDGISVEEKNLIEHKAMEEILSNLTDKEELLNMLIDFDKHESNESILAYYCDKIEADLQSKIYQEKNLHRSLDDQHSNIVFKNLNIQEYINNGATTAFDIWYLYDKHIYKRNENFKEFSDLLNYIKNNNIYLKPSTVKKYTK